MRVFVTAKRGRPRKDAAANDNRPDCGTPELQRRRAARARGVAPEAATHPLDLLLAHGLIDAAEQRAGGHYAALYRRVIGRAEMSYGRLYAGLAGESRGRSTAVAADSAGEALAQLRFRAAQAALRQEGAGVAGITERLAVFGDFPDWLLGKDGRAQHQRQLLRQGLQSLVTAFGRKSAGLAS